MADNNTDSGGRLAFRVISLAIGVYFSIGLVKAAGFPPAETVVKENLLVLVIIDTVREEVRFQISQLSNQVAVSSAASNTVIFQGGRLDDFVDARQDFEADDSSAQDADFAEKLRNELFAGREDDVVMALTVKIRAKASTTEEPDAGKPYGRVCAVGSW